MTHASQASDVENVEMLTKRAAARAEAAEMIDLEARLAPFFPPPVAHLSDQNDDGSLAAGADVPADQLCAGV
jgi:hypothetical protein